MRPGSSWFRAKEAAATGDEPFHVETHAASFVRRRQKEKDNEEVVTSKVVRD